MVRTLCSERSSNPTLGFSKRDSLEHTELGLRTEGRAEESGSSGASGAGTGDRRQPGGLCSPPTPAGLTRLLSPYCRQAFPWERKPPPASGDPYPSQTYVLLSSSAWTNPKQGSDWLAAGSHPEPLTLTNIGYSYGQNL